ncbi:subclass B1 metallo-beta-lactamase [Dyadobacter fermentans]|uniref:beta-lactamase n=2 Tax=Dyadobacter fermentans (strain ATCC 700827 / DSM 18053 / CIP 107007 / KCTC 52180 / NS114) TaxID=471854 RepID=C6W709_DYAFD|nr:subclass B1 metallo-beta-lactamase [Dyadobacter fermentans]ACT92618.1 Beta-lactamase [Dyadobacter fermentans DSM 18053]
MQNHILTCLLALVCAYAHAQTPDKSFKTDDLIVQKLTDHTYQHLTYLQTQTFGKVPCNGLIVFDGGEAVIFDTPADDATSEKVIRWVEDSLKCKVKAVIATHFHEDCVGGLKAFHEHGIPSYATNKTIAFDKEHKFPVPQKGFDNKLELNVGTKPVVAAFYGEGHTRDNIIGYFPSEKVMFGGCLIKEVDATKGNLADANVDVWPATVANIRKQYSDVKVVIPGHGKIGGSELLDYTIKLFSQK